MISDWLKLLILLSAAGVIGYLARRTGLCMIRGVMLLREGNPLLMLAMLLCGACIWLVVPVANLLGLEVPLVRYDWHYYFFLGGLIFGLGASANGGCTVSTLWKLASGDPHMAFTMSGWIIGWCIWLAMMPVPLAPLRLSDPSLLMIVPLILLLIFLSIWVVRRSKGAWLWFGVMAVGLLSGILFVLQPLWSPSSLVQDLANGLLQQQPDSWPTLDRYLVLFSLLAGMLVAAWLAQCFTRQRLSVVKSLLHLGSGVAMGIGASMAMGGNDAQLLLALPGFSPAGLMTVTGMLAGIYLGISLQGYFVALRRLTRS